MRSLLTPRWLVTHALVLIATIVMTQLGMWQLRRLDEARTVKERLEARLDSAPVAFGDLDGIAPGQSPTAAAVEFTRVRATGTYRADEEVLHRSRAHQGRNGWHVLTPLELDDGTAVLVRRGWVPYELDEPPIAAAAPPSGRVEVTGYLEASEPQPSFGARDPEEGALQRVFRADTARLDAQTDAPLRPVVLHLETQSPAQAGDLPIPAPRPEIDTGRHLSYALQWFTFAAIAVGGYAIVILRRHGRSSDDEAAAVTART